jgi:hypothetical protein
MPYNYSTHYSNLWSVVFKLEIAANMKVKLTKKLKY